MKRAFCIFLVLLVFLTFMSGCSSSKSDESEASAAPESSSSEEDSSEEDSGSSSEESGESGKEDEKKGVITVEGSSSLQPLITMAVGKFMEKGEFKGAVTINGSNSIKGLSEVGAGSVNVGMSAISPEQAGIDGTGLTDNQVAIVAIGVVVSKDVAANLKDISAADLKGIYSGTLTDWKQVKGWKGGSVPINVICRKAGSGSRYLFDTYGSGVSLTDEKLSAMENFKILETSSDVYSALENGQGTIGYLALPYCTKLKPLKIDGVEAKYEKVYTGDYKIWGCVRLYTKGEPAGPVKAFVKFLTSDDFKETVTKSGYGLISEMKVSR